MNGRDQHQRARLLLEERSFGIISEPDAKWLAAHLDECAACHVVESDMQSAIALLCSEPVTAPTFLVSRTKASVRIRARELQEHSERTRLLVLSLALALVFTSGTIYGGYLLYLSGWAAVSGAKGLLSAFALVWFWVAPAVLMVAATMYKRDWLQILHENNFGRGLGND